MQKKTNKSAIKLLRISLELLNLGIGVMPLYLLGHQAAKEESGDARLGIINGLFCASIAMCFSFPFIHHEVDAIPSQWKQANQSGKAFIAISSLLAGLSTGLPNSYYMRGNVFLKIIALIVPSFAGRAIAAEGLLRLHLWMRAKWDPERFAAAHEAQNLLAAYIIKMNYNDAFKESIAQTPSSEFNTHAPEQTCAKKLIRAHRQKRFELDDLISMRKVTKFSNNRKALLLLSLIAGVAAHKIFYNLSLTAGSCVYGALFQANYVPSENRTDCPSNSTTLAKVGHILGFSGYLSQMSILIYSVLKLADIAAASRGNAFKRSRTIIYLVSALLAICRSSVSVYMEKHNNAKDENAAWVWGVASVFMFFNFFSLAINGVDTIRTITRILQEAILCQQQPSASAEETDVLVDANRVTLKETIAAANQLRLRCLYHPQMVSAELKNQPLSIQA